MISLLDDNITMMTMFQVKEAGLSEFQELFDHEAYSAINHFKLSTSQVPVALPLSFMGEEIDLSVLNYHVLTLGKVSKKKKSREFSLTRRLPPGGVK